MAVDIKGPTQAAPPEVGKAGTLARSAPDGSRPGQAGRCATVRDRRRQDPLVLNAEAPGVNACSRDHKDGFRLEALRGWPLAPDSSRTRTGYPRFLITKSRRGRPPGPQVEQVPSPGARQQPGQPQHHDPHQEHGSQGFPRERAGRTVRARSIQLARQFLAGGCQWTFHHHEFVALPAAHAPSVEVVIHRVRCVATATGDLNRH
jgi:hypothetical protein